MTDPSRPGPDRIDPAPLARHQAEPDDEQLRDGLIQRFEFTYELSHKTLRRCLTAWSADPGSVAALPFPDLIRLVSDQGLLLGDWTTWSQWRTLREKSSHTYEEETARRVAGAIPGFLAEARFLLDRLTERLAGAGEGG